MLRDACALLLFDEVQCGIGRMGYFLAYEAFGVTPDMMTLAKPLAGGLPIGVVLTTKKVAAAVNPWDHGNTFAGGPLVCHVALTVLDKIKEQSFLASVSKKGLYLKELLGKILGDNPHVKEIGGVGLIVGIELDTPAGPVVDACREAGLPVLTDGKGNIVRLIPPLIISEKELLQAADILGRCLLILGSIPEK